MEPIDPVDLPILQNRLGFDLEDSKTALINTISIDNQSSLVDLFYKYFYVPSEDIIEEENRFTHSLDNGCLYKLIHANSKNGKTTFINHVKYLINKDILRAGINREKAIFILYDFELSSGGNFLKKVRTFYSDNFIDPDEITQQNIINSIGKYHEFLVLFKTKLKEESYFIPSNFIQDNIVAIIKLMKGVFLDDPYFKQLDFVDRIDYFQKILDKEVTLSNCGYFFIYLMMFQIFCNGTEIVHNKVRILVCLDNIDDYLVNNDVSFLQHPQISISTFFFMLSRPHEISNVFIRALNQKIASPVSNPLFSFKTQFSFIYIFRTANFLVFANLMTKIRSTLSSPSEKYSADTLLSNEYFELHTENTTSEIFKTRLDRFQEIAVKSGLEIPQGYHFLDSLAANFDSTEYDIEQRNVRRIYNIWNGDKFALWDLISRYWDDCEENYFIHEDVILRLSSFIKSSIDNNTMQKDVLEWYTYLLRGVHINFFLYLMESNKNLEPLLEHTIYPYRDPNSGKIKSINRIILNYIINNSKKSERPKKIRDIDAKGVGLFDLLETVTEYINEINSKSHTGEDIYDPADVEKYFSDVCELKIDHFAQLFVIYKDQIEINSANEQEYSNIYNVNKEIAKFRKEGKACKKELNKIRIFHNDSAAYISDSLLTSFELYSFTLSGTEGVNLPLLFLMKRNIGVDIVKKESDFLFFNIINRVYNNVVSIMNNMVDFYIKQLIILYPPEKFPRHAFFSKLYIVKPNRNEEETVLEGDFQFLMTISRHITYIQYFRQIILKYNGGILDLNSGEKKIANIFLINILKQYFSLYIENFIKINDVHFVPEETKLFQVKRTYTRFISIANKYILDNSFDMIQ